MSSIDKTRRARTRIETCSRQAPVTGQAHEALGAPLPQQRLAVAKSYQIFKRCIDIAGALLGLLVLLLLLPWIAFLILWEDQGPIFYRQERIGLYGDSFRLYKLRSMVSNADEYLARHPDLLRAWQHTGKLQDDPRVTRIGRFLRRTSLDELPQVLNILRGEMSLVGPRAIQASELASFDQVEGLGGLRELRQQVKPGLTGLWQVSGRSSTTYEQRFLLDCTYALECSMATDIHILLRTFVVVLHGKGAY